MTLEETIKLFKQANRTAEASGGLVVPFGSDSATISYYFDQMVHLAMHDLDEAYEFIQFLKTIPAKEKDPVDISSSFGE